MKHKNYVIWLVLMILFSCKEAPPAETKEIGTTPEEALSPNTAEYTDLEGNALAIKDFKGKRVLLNYWATWCRPCIEEMPDLLKLQSHLAQENYIFLLASDQSIQKIKDFKSAKGYDFNFIKYNGSYAQHQINALPVTIIYNAAGEQVSRFDGGMSWDTPEMVKQLKNIR